MPNPIVFVHGYSDEGTSWKPWRDIMAAATGLPSEKLRTLSYVSLNNEVTIKDIAEGFERALTAVGGLEANEPFDAIVHSTGIQVIRSWIDADPRRAARLKRLIALAPATFGSPIAKTGRSWLGAIFKGNEHLGPDFLNAGKLVLRDLEPASPYNWSLADRDIEAGASRYSNGPGTPYVFVFCGTGTYKGIRELVNTPGSDGTVRRAGAGMKIRRIDIDMTQEARQVRIRRPVKHYDDPVSAADRVIVDKWLHTNIPVHLIGAPDGSDGVNHATILSAPPAELQQLVLRALKATENPTTAETGYLNWQAGAGADRRIAAMSQKFQQFIVHAVDERGDPIEDYNLQLYSVGGTGADQRLTEFTAEVDVFDGDPSYRSFHVDVAALLAQAGGAPLGLSIRVLASSGTGYIGYIGFGFEAQTTTSAWDTILEFSGDDLRRLDFFQPYTTTLVRLYLERQVLPPDLQQISTILTWDPP